MSNSTFEHASQAYGFEPQYSLSNEDVTRLSSELFASQPPKTSDRFICYDLDGTSELSNLGRHIESTVFNDAFSNNEDVMKDGYGKYEAASSFMVVMDQQKKQPIGALRIIENSPAGLKTLNDIKEAPLNILTEDFKAAHNVDNLDECWDVGTVAVLPEYRSSTLRSQMLSIMLYRALYVKAMRDEVKHFVAVIDSRAHRGLNTLGVPFVPIKDSETFSYMGSESSAALYGYVPDFFEKMDARLKRIKEKHPIKSIPLSHALGRLMLGKHVDDKLQFPL